MYPTDPLAHTDKGIGKIVDIKHRHYERHDKREANNNANPMISLRLLPSQLVCYQYINSPTEKIIDVKHRHRMKHHKQRTAHRIQA